ncbi:MAG TPA: DUF4148 domain-containing protein [Albitalea sp.]|jgi:hypothetical protein|nr:DUF4148 domain-containing protein [Albitalea sp.]
MKVKHIITAAIVIGSASTAALAIEATQFEDTPSTLTREEVRAELERARLDGTLMSGGEATVFVDGPVAQAPRSRQQVRVEAHAAIRDHAFEALYVGG